MKTVVALTTCGDEQQAKTLARLLVSEAKAACVNIIPKVTSIYEWEGKLCEEAEWLLVIKTAADRVEALKRAVNEHHSYDLPELIVLDIQDGSGDYLRWLGEQTR